MTEKEDQIKNTTTDTTEFSLSLEKNNLSPGMMSVSFMTEVLVNKFVYIDNGHADNQDSGVCFLMIKEVTLPPLNHCNNYFYLSYFNFNRNEDKQDTRVVKEWFYLAVLLCITNNKDFQSLELFCRENNIGYASDHHQYFMKIL